MIASNYTNLSKDFISAEYLGLQNYGDVSQKQDDLSGALRGTRLIHILGMEFYPVITLGVRGDYQQDLSQPETQTPIPIIKTDRGGQATLHTPGQLVIYPMLDLKEYKLGVRDFVCVVLRATSRTLRLYGISSQSGAAPGLYTEEGKIAFLGIRLNRGVVKHGLALNINNELPLFNTIKSCGIAAAAVDKMQNHFKGEPMDLNSIFQTWTQEFADELRSTTNEATNLNQTCVKSFTTG